MEGVKVLRGRAKSLGLEMLLWEPMPVPREKPWTLEDAREVLKTSNQGDGVPVKLTIDVGHQCRSEGPDGDPYEWLAELATESPVIHLQQTDGKADRHWPFSARFNEPTNKAGKSNSEPREAWRERNPRLH